MNTALRRKWSAAGWGYLMVLPTIAGLIVLNIWPMIQSMYLSLCSSGDFGSFEWQGVDNYVRLASDPAFWRSTWNTLYFALLMVPAGVLLSLVTAQFLNTGIRGKGFFRTIYFIPVVSAPAAVAMIWRWIYNADYGILNQLLAYLSIDGPSWNTDPAWSMISVSVIAVWQVVGYNIIILLAGLQGIPSMYYEAAMIDGASSRRRFKNITLPLLTPSIFFVVITSIINAFKQFDLIYMMYDATNTNPAYPSTRTMVRYYYEMGFQYLDKAYASAVIMVLLFIILIVTLVQFRLQDKWVHYSG